MLTRWDINRQITCCNGAKLEALPKGIGTLCDWYVAGAENATLWDQEGNSWIDFAGGIAVLNTGHRHPRIEQAIADRIIKFAHTAPINRNICTRVWR